MNSHVYNGHVDANAHQKPVKFLMDNLIHGFNITMLPIKCTNEEYHSIRNRFSKQMLVFRALLIHSRWSIAR